MTLIKYAQVKDGLTRVSWKIKICGVNDLVTIDNLIFPRPDRFKVICLYKLISGCKTKGPCVFNVWLTLIDKTIKEDRKEDIDRDYCYQPFSVWGNVYDFTSCNQGEKHLLKKSSITEEWISDLFLIEFPARSSRDWKSENNSTGSEDDTNSLYLNCVLWIQFEITVSRSEINVCKQLTDLFVRQTNCDVDFCFENNQRIGGHIAILVARSPVFAAMFQHNMKEFKTGQVVIRDIQIGIFKQLIYFIYSGRLGTQLKEEDVQPLYVAADKYDVVDLKEKCVNFILSRLRMDNSVHLLAWAHLYSIHKIQEAALDFIAVNGKEICFSDDWANLTRNYPDLSLLATQRMMDKMCLISSKPKNC